MENYSLLKSMNTSSRMTESIITYSPELIEALDKESKDYPIDPMVLAILNGIKKTAQVQSANHGSGRGRQFNGGPRNHNTHRVDGPLGPSSPHGPVHHIPNGNYPYRSSTDHNNTGTSYRPIDNHGRGRGKGHYHNPAQRGDRGDRGDRGERGERPDRAERSEPTVRRKLYVEEGDTFLVNIKNLLAKLSSENYVRINEQLLSYELDKADTLEEVTKLLHESAINGEFIVDYYVDLFLSVAKKFPKLVPSLNLRIMRQIHEPRDFAEESDTLTETRQQKADRWQKSNILIFAELYKRGVYKEDKFREILGVLLSRASTENLVALKLITELLQKVTKSYIVARRDRGLEDIIKRLELMSKDKSYPGTISIA
jgi:hypothetical protein